MNAEGTDNLHSTLVDTCCVGLLMETRSMELMLSRKRQNAYCLTIMILLSFLGFCAIPVSNYASGFHGFTMDYNIVYLAGVSLPGISLTLSFHEINGRMTYSNRNPTSSP